MSNVTIDDQGGLLCPRCGGANLHHELITIYSRQEDEETVRVTTVESRSTLVDARPSRNGGNPSSRRDGLIVTFSCEHCSVEEDEDSDDPGPRFELTIVQHKGTTYLKWR